MLQQGQWKCDLFGKTKSEKHQHGGWSCYGCHHCSCMGKTSQKFLCTWTSNIIHSCQQQNIATQGSHTVSQYVCRWCGFCTQLMATEERCDCLHKFIRGRIDLNLILSKKIVIQGSHIVWEIGVQMVCVDFVHSSWVKSEMRLSTRIQKSTRSQSHSLHPKKIYCYTTIAYCDDLGCIRCVWILYTAHGVRREMQLSTQTVFRLILYKQKIFRHKDLILCEKSVYRWYVSILYTDQGNMR